MPPPPILGVILAGGLSRRMGGGDKALIRLGGTTLLARVTERLAPQCAAGLVLSANGDPARFAGFPGPVVPDGVAGNPGPLAGILAALETAAKCKALPTQTPHPEVPRSGLEGGLQNPRSDLEPSFEARLRLAPQDEGVGGVNRRVESSSFSAVTHVVSVSGDTPFVPDDLVARLYDALGDDEGRIALATSGDRQHFTVALWPVALRHDLRAALVDRDERRVGAFIARHGSVQASWPKQPFDPFLNVNTPEDLAEAEAILARTGP